MTLMNKQQPNQSTHTKQRRSKFFAAVTIPVLLFIPIVFFILSLSSLSSCGVYRFQDISIPDSIKTVKINFIENKAPYINPQLSPRLTDRLRQKIVSQTRLSQTNNDNADWIVNGTITNYSFSTSGIANQREATNRLTVSVHLVVNKQKSDETKEYDVSRNFEFSANKSIQQAEAELGDGLVKGLVDDIFNRIFSDW
jgi:hypothetical protein